MQGFSLLLAARSIGNPEFVTIHRDCLDSLDCIWLNNGLNHSGIQRCARGILSAFPNCHVLCTAKTGVWLLELTARGTRARIDRLMGWTFVEKRNTGAVAVRDQGRKRFEYGP